MDNFGPRKTVHDEPISSLHSSDSGEGKKMGEYFFIIINCSLAETKRPQCMTKDI